METNPIIYLTTESTGCCVLLATYLRIAKLLSKYSKKYAAHDENNTAHVGDKVRLAQTRPLSKTKRYELVEVIEKAVIL